MAQELRFDGQVVAIAGGGSGLGRQYCLDLARSGSRVIVGGRGASADRVVAEIHALGGRAASCIGDVRDGESLIAGAIEAFGRIDGLIVNAGIVLDRSFTRMSREEWRDVISVHVDGAFECVKAAWPHMIRQGGGRIVLTTSGAGLHGNFGQANYATAKAGLIGFMRTIAIEGARNNIFCNAVAPMASTAMTAGVFDAQMKSMLAPSLVSPIVVALVHAACRENGAVIETGGGWASRLRWQRSRGVRFATSDFDAGDVLEHWHRIVTFDQGVDYPSSTHDCLDAALDRH